MVFILKSGRRRHDTPRLPINRHPPLFLEGNFNPIFDGICAVTGLRRSFLWQSGLVLTPLERYYAVRINPDSHPLSFRIRLPADEACPTDVRRGFQAGRGFFYSSVSLAILTLTCFQGIFVRFKRNI